MKIEHISQIKHLLPQPSIERDLHQSFFQSLSEPEVSILYGPRQVGKSTEVGHCLLELLKLKKKADIFYFNLDVIPKDFSDPDRFLNLIASQKSEARSLSLVFLDEAQRLENIGLFVKYIFDQKLGIKFVLTGSASLDIKERIKEPLTGRKREFYLPPLTLGEILRFKKVNLKAIRGSFGLLEETLSDYLLYGGYPQVFLEKDAKRKRRKLSEISETYILRDISNLFGISNPQNLLILASYLAENIGNLLSKENISMLAAVSKYEVEKILSALERSFIVWQVRPFSKNKAKELVHRPKIYFQDLGIRNVLLRKFEPDQILYDRGKLFENAMAVELRALYGKDQIKYWRKIGGTEVDFVVLKDNGRMEAFEAKYSTKTGSKLPRNILSFKKDYGHLVESAKVLSRHSYWQIPASKK